MFIQKILAEAVGSTGQKPEPKNMRLQVTGRLPKIIHRLPTKKGKPDGKRHVNHLRAERVDHSRYPGSVLREIRSRRLNFHGEVQR